MCERDFFKLYMNCHRRPMTILGFKLIFVLNFKLLKMKFYSIIHIMYVYNCFNLICVCFDSFVQYILSFIEYDKMYGEIKRTIEK